MIKKTDKALTTFRSGYNCAQAVLAAYCDDLEFDKDLGLSISCGFGGGMGKLQKTCGAVTGSFMVLSIYNSKLSSDNHSRKEKSYSMIQKFSNKFELIHGTTECKSLINCDLNTEEGHSYAKQNNLFQTICEKCITDSVIILEELIKK